MADLSLVMVNFDKELLQSDVTVLHIDHIPTTTVPFRP